MSRYARFKRLRVDKPGEARIIEPVLDVTNLNAVSEGAHADLAEVWREFDADPDVRAVLLRGEGNGFSAGGSFELVERMSGDYEVRSRVMREARDLVYNVLDCSKTDRLGDTRPGGRRRPDGRGPSRRLCGDENREDHRWAHQAGGRGGRPRGHLLAAALWHGQGEVLEFYRFDGPEVQEGLASHREHRQQRF
jgi:hypothetical protein